MSDWDTCQGEWHRFTALIPAPGWWSVFLEEDGTTNRYPLIGWGLCAEGNVHPLDTDAEGMTNAVTGENFVRLSHDSDPPEWLDESIRETQERLARAAKKRQGGE